MSWNYENKIIEYIAKAQYDTGMNQYNVEVCTEQIFAKISTLLPDTIYVVIKYLSSTNTLNAVVQPVQLIILCEQNQIQASQIIFSQLVASHNFEVVSEGSTYVKQDYREPVVLSNFNEVSYGYRTIMYISGTLFIMDNVIDVSDLKIKINDYILVDLTQKENSLLNNCLKHGNKTNEITRKYWVSKTDLLARYAEIVNPDAFYGLEMYNESGWLMLVNGIKCRSFQLNFVNNLIGLFGNNVEFIDSFLFSEIDGFTIEFLPSEDKDVTVDYILTEEHFDEFFEDLITKKAIGLSDENVKPINFNIAYAMTPNTQPIPPAKIATSVKSLSTFSISFTVPMVSTYEFIEIISYIASGNMTGNTNFYVSFTLGAVVFTEVPMKLISTQITTAINEIPGLQIGLIK